MRSHLESILTRTWMHRGVLAWLLLPIAGLYRLLTLTHRYWYAWGLGTVGHATVPVIVVGNVVAGGAGKTPIVMALVEHLHQRGLAVGIVARGHGRSKSGAQLVTPASTAQEVGDEPLLLAQRSAAPVAVARRRLDAVHALMAAHPETQVIISDDGLQHLALWHDMALCVFDDRGVGNGWPLPAGPLREAWPRTPRPGSVQRILHTRTSLNPRPADTSLEGFAVHRQLSSHARNARGETKPLSDWIGRPVQAMAGIAHPHRFFAMLQQNGLTLHAQHPLADHAALPELEAALRRVPHQQDLVCTEKDAVKLWPTHPDIWAVPLTTTLPPALLTEIDLCLAPKLSFRHGQQTA